MADELPIGSEGDAIIADLLGDPKPTEPPEHSGITQQMVGSAWLWRPSSGYELLSHPTESIADATQMEDEIERRGLQEKYVKALLLEQHFEGHVPEPLDYQLTIFGLIHATPAQRSQAAYAVLKERTKT